MHALPAEADFTFLKAQPSRYCRPVRADIFCPSDDANPGASVKGPGGKLKAVNTVCALSLGWGGEAHGSSLLAPTGSLARFSKEMPTDLLQYMAATKASRLPSAPRWCGDPRRYRQRLDYLVAAIPSRHSSSATSAMKDMRPCMVHCAYAASPLGRRNSTSARRIEYRGNLD